DEHDGAMRTDGGGQSALKLQTVKTRHRNIQNGTPGHRHIMFVEEKLRRCIGLHFIAPGAEQSRQRLEHARVVIDEIDCEFLRHAASIAGAWVGNENPAIAPPPSWFTKVSLPPCAWMMVEQIVNPRPRPWSFVV